MAKLKKLLAPTDFSELSAKGVRYASELATDLGAEILLFNVVVLDESNAVDKDEIEQHKRRLDAFAAQNIPATGADLKMRQLVMAGQPHAAIVECAATEHVDLVVMSSHGRSGLSRMLIGSVTDRVLRASPCPVLVVPVEKTR